MLILGLILLVVGALTGIQLLVTVGIVLLILGLVLLFAGALGYTVGGRGHWY